MTCQVDVSVAFQSPITNIPILTAGGTIQTQKGPAIGIIRNTAHAGHGRTIASSLQLEAFGMDVNDKALSLGGKQHIATPDGYIVRPICISLIHTLLQIT